MLGQIEAPQVSQSNNVKYHGGLQNHVFHFLFFNGCNATVFRSQIMEECKLHLVASPCGNLWQRGYC